MIPCSSQSSKSITKTLISWKMSGCLPDVHGLVCPFYIHSPPSSLTKQYISGSRNHCFGNVKLIFWRWSAIPRCRRLKQNLTKASMEDFPEHSLSVSCRLRVFIVNCVSRWQLVTPLGRSLFMMGNKLTSLLRQGIPHQSTSDDLHNDYHIPANSIIIPNQWWWQFPATKYWAYLVTQTLLNRAMLNDDPVYPEPHILKPEGFLKNGKLNSSVRDPMDMAFGFDRR